MEENIGRRRGPLSAEAKLRMQQARKTKNKCVRCGQMGHFAGDCTVSEGLQGNFGLNKLRAQSGTYDITQDLLDSKANITLGQVYNESPSQRTRLHQALRRGYSEEQ